MKKLVRDANIRDGYVPHPRWAGELNRLAQPLAGCAFVAPVDELEEEHGTALADAGVERMGLYAWDLLPLPYGGRKWSSSRAPTPVS